MKTTNTTENKRLIVERNTTVAMILMIGMILN